MTQHKMNSFLWCPHNHFRNLLFAQVAIENKKGDNEGAMLKHIFVILTW